MEINNNFPNKESRNSINSSQLSYKDNNEEGNSVSKATDNSSTRNLQYIQNEVLVLKNTFKL